MQSVPETTESLAPTHPEEIRERIAARAYELWQQRGGGHGNDVQDWLQPEKEVLQGKQGQTDATDADLESHGR